VFEDEEDSNPSIRQLETWRGLLVARGQFDAVSGEPANGLAAWDGEDWAPLASELQGRIDAIGVHQDRLVVAGILSLDGEDYETPGSILQNDGDRWLTMGSGLNRGYPWFASAGVSALATSRGSLFVGGDFLTAGDKHSLYIARWDGMPLAPLPIDRLRAAPNPTTDHSVLEFRLDGPGHTAVHVFDIQGRRIKTLHDGFMTGGDHTAVWDLRDDTGRRVPAGVYFLRVASPFSRATEKVVVIR
jgi:hypothetical protein